MAVLAGKRVHDNLVQEVLLAGTLGTGARSLSLHLHLHQRNLRPVMKISIYLFHRVGPLCQRQHFFLG